MLSGLALKYRVSYMWLWMKSTYQLTSLMKPTS